MRLIDADKLDWWYKGRPIRRVIDEAPTVDAVPVVRCKDCINAEYFNGVLCCAMAHDVVRQSNDFCSYGERENND